VKPLEGLTILDLSRVLACPFASMILAELGARVIKVEQPGSGDETRTFEPQLARDSAYYFACNRSKESITVNLRSDEGRKLIRELAQRADVLVENFPVGTLGRYGLDFAALSALNPRLIYVSCTGFGQTGPYREKKGYDTVFQAMGGIMSLTGERGGGPVKPGLPVADLSSGLWVAISILAALAGRSRTGKGCQIDFSMLDGQVALLTLAAARYFALGEVPPRLGTEHPGRVPSATFRSKDGKFAHITASDQHWAPLCKALGLEEWGAAFPQNETRVERRDEVMQVLTEKISRLTRAELIALLDATEWAQKDSTVKVVFVRGNGPMFCGGADLKERQGKSEQWIRERRLKAFAAYEALEALPMPCIALAHGAVIGSGVEIAAACDFIVATPDVTFRTPEAQRGTVGATQRLPRILGKRLAKDMMFTGRALTAEEAREASLVARIVSDLEVAKREIAEAILKAPPLAMRLGKRAIDRGIELDPKGAREAEIEAIEEQLAAGQWMGKS